MLSNPLFIVSHLVAAGHVPYWSALHFYGFTGQVPLTNSVATTKKRRSVTFRVPVASPARSMYQNVGSIPTTTIEPGGAGLCRETKG